MYVHLDGFPIWILTPDKDYGRSSLSAICCWSQLRITPRSVVLIWAAFAGIDLSDLLPYVDEEILKRIVFERGRELRRIIEEMQQFGPGG